MKKILVILTVLVFGFTMVGCDTGSYMNLGPEYLIGRWEPASTVVKQQIGFANNAFFWQSPNNPSNWNRAPATYSNSEMIITGLSSAHDGGITQRYRFIDENTVELFQRRSFNWPADREEPRYWYMGIYNRVR